MTETPSSYLEELYQEELFNLPPQTVVVIPTGWADLTEADKSLLSKILSAIRVGLPGVRIVAEPTVSRKRLLQFGARQVLIFGSAFQPDAEPYRIHEVEGIKLILTGKLQSLDEPRKKLLWAALKEMFVI